MLVLIFLIVLIWLLPKYFGRADVEILPVTTGNASALNNDKKIADSVGVKKLFRLFYFDPNRITDDQWYALGVSDKNLRTIRNYLSKGGQFRSAEDIRKIYGLREDVVTRLLPFVRIETEMPNRYGKAFLSTNGRDQRDRNASHVNRWVRNKEDKSYSSGYSRGPQGSATRKPFVVLELNSADTVELIALPGIGPTLAKRIALFRKKCGGFYSVHQLAEVYGLKDTVYQQLLPRLSVDPLLVRPLYINKVGQDSLQLHPYVNFSEARAIIKYRGQHGPFRTSADLLNVAFITDEWINKISPYLNFSGAEKY